MKLLATAGYGVRFEFPTCHCMFTAHNIDLKEACAHLISIPSCPRQVFAADLFATKFHDNFNPNAGIQFRNKVKAFVFLIPSSSSNRAPSELPSHSHSTGFGSRRCKRSSRDTVGFSWPGTINTSFCRQQSSFSLKSTPKS